MLEGYHKFLRGLAGGNVKKIPQQPKDNLNVDRQGEEMGLLVKSYKFVTVAQQPQVYPDYSMDGVRDVKNGPKVESNEFPRTGWIGEGVYYE